ncbi:cold-shock protein [uncultured Campylobacter sp.]|uniref:cold-shock protein n=1 Tax=uncultured Campylobacter sp. TaxID=218934 RepID=UPI0026030986|nr:cold shock domain-containing protein [uncultured Campylobacter sp.]
MYSIKRDGKVKKFFSNKGFGFIEGSDGLEYFFHKNDIQSYHIKEGDLVEFVPGKNLKGYIYDVEYYLNGDDFIKVMIDIYYEICS